MPEEKKVFQHSLHKCVWDFVAKTGKDKDSWPMWERNGGKIPDILSNYDCFACEYADYGIGMSSSNCNSCPLEWGYGGFCSDYGEMDDQLYNRWVNASRVSEDYGGDRDEARELAEQIRDLPVRSGVEVS